MCRALIVTEIICRVMAVMVSTGSFQCALFWVMMPCSFVGCGVCWLFLYFWRSWARKKLKWIFWSRWIVTCAGCAECGQLEPEVGREQVLIWVSLNCEMGKLRMERAWEMAYRPRSRPVPSRLPILTGHIPCTVPIWWTPVSLKLPIPLLLKIEAKLFLWNVGVNLQSHMVLKHRRQPIWFQFVFAGHCIFYILQPDVRQ